MTNPSNITSAEDRSWTGLVSKAVRNGELRGSTCHLYSIKDQGDALNASESCVCGRRRRCHSFERDAQRTPRASETWEKVEHASEAQVTVYGEWENRTKFIRFDHTRVKAVEHRTSGGDEQPETSLSTMAEILIADAANKELNLLISCYGGAKYFKMNDKLEKEFMEGIGVAAATKGVWLLTAGLNSGVSKVIGQSVRRHALLNQKPLNHTVIGLSSWGCLSERTRKVLRRQTRLDSAAQEMRRATIGNVAVPFVLRCMANGSARFSLDDNQPDTFESNHTHLLLLDDGSQGECMTSATAERYYISDEPRSALVEELRRLSGCHAVTIIVEGGLNSIHVVEQDLLAKRPVVIIQGSGRLATALGNLLELTRDHLTIGKDENNCQLKNLIASQAGGAWFLANHLRTVKFILSAENRPFLSVFRLDDNASLTETIFLAVFKAQMTREKSLSDIKKMLDLAVMWNYVNGINDVLENKEVIKYDRTWNTDLFEKALINNRPAFVDYFLRRQYDVLETTEYEKMESNRLATTLRNMIVPMRVAAWSAKVAAGHNATQLDENERRCSIPNDAIEDELLDEANIRAMYAHKFIITQLYGKSTYRMKNSSRVDSLSDLDQLYYRLIGPCAESLFHVRSKTDRLQIDLVNKLRSLFAWLKCFQRKAKVYPDAIPEKPQLNDGDDENSPTKKHSSILPAIVMITGPDPLQMDFEQFGATKPVGSQEVLRDIFLWAVLEGHAELAFVLLLQLKCRIAAALLAAGIATRLMVTSDGYLDRLHKFQKQSNDYEQFARACIDACYKRSERRACQLLLREVPLFGNVTCMQIAIRFRIRSFISSRCFNQVLNRQWYGALNQTKKQSLLSSSLFAISLFSGGLLAPGLLTYRDDQVEFTALDDDEESSADRRWEGIEDQDGSRMNYFQKVRQFHRTPCVRMCYDFVFYIWMLLGFSYMMLFEIKTENTRIHWTEIYVITTISAMLVEDIRKHVIEYMTQMLERWHQSDLWMIGVYALPYLLFYIGIGLQFGSVYRPDLFSAARIVLALDLELWFLFSLRFVSAIKLLGPKLFMIRNMLRDLIGFVYIIFVCIAAYGVVSRSLTRQTSVAFNAKNLSSAVLYRSYWFLYSIIDDEMTDLNTILHSESSTQGEIAEATTNFILFAFHMLLVNILILNLLIAVFNFTINDVQATSEYFWRYQRYELIRGYFEQPLFAYPPLSILGYLCPLIKHCFGRRDVLRVFKRFVTKRTNADWTDFENAATYNHTRSFVDRMYCDSSTLVVPTFSETDELKAEIESLKRKSNQMSTVIENMDAQSKRTIPAMNWMMTAMDRVKMSSQRPPPLLTTATSDE